MVFLMFAALARTGCLDDPTPACLLDMVKTSPWMSASPPKRATMASRGVLAAVGGDAAEAQRLLLDPDRMGDDRQLAHYDLTQLFAVFDRFDWASDQIAKLPPSTALYFQARLALAERHAIDSVEAILAEIPEDAGFRTLVAADAVGVLLNAGEASRALKLVETLPEPSKSSAPGLEKPFDRDQGLMRIARWHLGAGRSRAARSLRNKLADPSTLDGLLRWVTADQATVRAEIENAPVEGLERRDALDKLATALTTVGRTDLLPTVLDAMEVLPNDDPRGAHVRNELVLLARHAVLETAITAYDGYDAELRSEAVYPLMITILTAPPRQRPPIEAVEFAQRIASDAAPVAMGHQKELALGMLAWRMGQLVGEQAASAR